MTWIIVALGVLIIGIGICGVVSPKTLIRAAGEVPKSTAMMAAAIAGRLILGAVLIIAADQTRYPATMVIIGVVLIAAGLSIAIMGKARLFTLVDYFLNISPAWIRFPAVVAIGAGAFFIHAAS